MKATISNPVISINPSKQLTLHITNMAKCDDMPLTFINIRSKQVKCIDDPKPTEHANLLLDEDRSFINTLDLHPAVFNVHTKDATIQDKNILVSVEDLLWLWNKIKENNGTNGQDLHLHELLMGSEIVLPQNVEIPRSEELDRRCLLLKRQQENRQYKAMTKNVDNVRKPLPEDTVSYQIKQMNKQLIAVAQFIISVLAGFAFGFQGIELLSGSLDFGFRLLLGVICSLIIALAELYFLAKKLNEDLQYEIKTESKTTHAKNN